MPLKQISRKLLTLHVGTLSYLLEAMNFHPRFSNWVQDYTNTIMNSIKINGQPEGFFKGKRGLRQGDPLSPYLFVMCMEVLNEMFNQSTGRGI